MNEQTNFQQEYQRNRSTAVTMAGFVYTGAVIAATVIFLFFVLTAFPETAYFIRFLMVLAGLLVGASALAFPVALHNWAVSGNHRKITTGFYYGEICLIVLNTVVSFSTLLYTYAGNTIPEWVRWYEPFTILSLGYVVLAWGTIFITDPQAKAKAKEKAVHDNFVISVAEDMEKWTKSVQGRQAIQDMALQKIRQSFQVKSEDVPDWFNPAENQLPDYMQNPQSPSVRPMQRPIPRPALPMRKEYTTDQLCDLWGMTRTGAGAVLKTYGTGPDECFNICMTNGYLPQDMTARNFTSIYYDLCPDMPGRIPQPVERGSNHRGNF